MNSSPTYTNTGRSPVHPNDLTNARAAYRHLHGRVHGRHRTYVARLAAGC